MNEINKWGRCAACNGTGRSNGGYCDCKLGQDLKRVEMRPKPPSAVEEALRRLDMGQDQ